MQSYFSSLPFETRVEILQHYPYFQSLSKTYNHEKQTFYNVHCNQAIGKNELLRYLVTQPYKFIMYGEINQEYYIYIFTKSWIGGYSVQQYKIYLNEKDNEYQVNLDVLHSSYIKDIIDQVDYIYNNFIVQLDIQSMEHILYHRSCEIIKPGYTKSYLKNYLKQYLNNHNITYMDELYSQLKEMMYLETSINMINDIPFYNTYSEYSIYSFVYDENGKMIHGQDDESLKQIYDQSLDQLLDYVNNL